MKQQILSKTLYFYRTSLRRVILLATYALIGGNPFAFAGTADSSATLNRDDALVILGTLDMESFHETVALVRNHGGEVPQAYPPNAFVALLNPSVEWALSEHPSVYMIERGVVDPAVVAPLDRKAVTAARIWNTVFREVPDPLAAGAPLGPVPEQDGPDFVLPPPEETGVQGAPRAPTSTQTSEFMAGNVVYSVVFVESSSGTGNCSPADPQTENWITTPTDTVLSEISAGLTFWTSRANSPKPLTFMLDNRGIRFTSCEPINRSSSDQGLWVADALTAMGFPATPGNYFDVSRSFADSRRTALGGDWGFVIFVVNSLNDTDGSFSNGAFAYAYLNGPFMVLTYDNDGWGISRMDRVALHETGHIFGALDEYASSGCFTSDSSGYLNVSNASCNNGGITSDISVMGEGSELDNPAADVSTSAREALGWRNPTGAGGKIVDVIRTATVSLTPFTPDPTADSTPTYSASAGNSPFPPGGCNTLGGFCFRVASSVTVSKVQRAQWRLDSGSFTSNGVIPSDGAFNEESGEAYTFTPSSSVSVGTHTFRTRSINNFGHTSKTKLDRLTIN